MKVLHVYRTYFPDNHGGVEEAIRQICLSTQALGIENTVFTLSPKPRPARLARPEADVLRCRSWAAPASCDLGGPASLLAFRRAVRAADVVHYLFPWPFADVLQLFAPRRPSVLTYISDIVRQKYLGAAYAPLMWHTLKRVDAIVSNAPGYARSSPVLHRLAGSGRIHQIPLGIDEHSVVTDPDARIYSRLGIGGSEPFILFLGVDRYYKGLHILLEACRTTNGRVVIAGAGTLAGTLPGQVQRLGLTNCTIAGEVTEAEKAALLQRCRALVLPSHLRSEAYGMVLVEASLFGRPMISCEIGTGTSFVNRDGETGLVVSPNSAAELARAMNTLLADRDLAETFGRAARKRYERLFSGPALGHAYADLFAAVGSAESNRLWTF